MADLVPVTMVNHVAMDVAASPDAVWRTIVEDYVEARKFREIGGVIEPLDGASAVFGGYLMRFERAGTAIDERIVRITERDEIARRLSVAAEYLSVPGGMTVYASYHAQHMPRGTRYAIDCHTALHIDAAGGSTDVAQTLAEMTAGADAHLVAYLENVKARVEAGA